MLKASEIETGIYGENGLYQRTVEKIESVGIKTTMEKTGKSRQRVDIFRRQYKHPEKFDGRPKLETIREFAEPLGVE